MQCPRCSSENDEASKFCWSCGTPLHKMPVPQAKVACPFCKHENASNANFCVACGKNIWRQSTGAAPVIAAVAPEKAAETAATTDAQSAKLDSPRSTPRASIPPQAMADDYNAAIKPEPRKSRFELAAGLIVLIAVLGGAILWWNHQKETRLAEIAVSSVVPAAVSKPAISAKPAANSTWQNYSTAIPALPTPPGSSSRSNEAIPENAAVPVTSETSVPTETKPVKRSTVKQAQTKSTYAAPVGLTPEELRAEPVAQAPARPPEPKPPTTREKVAACKQLSLFQKESCMWGICNGKWGKEGCPSYDR